MASYCGFSKAFAIPDLCPGLAGVSPDWVFLRFCHPNTDIKKGGIPISYIFEKANVTT